MREKSFKSKALKSFLAAGVATTPVITAGVAFNVAPGNASAESVDSSIAELASRFFQFYNGANVPDLSSNIADINFEDHVQGYVTKTLETDEKEALVNLLKGVSTLIYSNYASEADLEEAVSVFRTTYVGDFNLLFEGSGEVTVDQLLAFISDLEPALEVSIRDSIGTTPTYSTIVNNAVQSIIGDYPELDGKLGDVGLSVERLFNLQTFLNDNVVDPGASARSVLLSTSMDNRGAEIEATNNVFKLNVPYSFNGVSVTISLEDEIQWTVTAGTGNATFNGNVLTPTRSGTITVNAQLDGITLLSKDVSVSTGSGPVIIPPSPVDPETPGETEPPADTIVEEDGTISVPADKVDQAVSVINEQTPILNLTLPEQSGNASNPSATVPGNLFSKAVAQTSNAQLKVGNSSGTVLLPASLVSDEVSNIAGELGLSTEELSIVVSVTKQGKDVQDKMKDANPDSKFLGDAIDFSVSVVTEDGKSYTLSGVNSYIERSVTLGQSVDSKKTTGALYNEDTGNITFVPSLFATDEDGNTLATLKRNGFSIYTVVENDKTFPDVNNGKNWSEDYVEVLANKLVINGKPDGTYKPNESMTRMQFTVLLVRALGLPLNTEYTGDFKDVKGNEWFIESGELQAALDYGLIGGHADGTLNPNGQITRSQVAMILKRVMELELIDFDFTQLDSDRLLTDFNDALAIQKWGSTEAVLAVYQAGFFDGSPNGGFNPGDPATRAQMAKVLGEFMVSAKLIDDVFSK